MPTLDGIKAALTDHLQGLIKNITLGSTGGEASSRDGGAGNPQITQSPSIQRIDDRTVSFTAVFDTTLTSSNAIKEIVMHGDTSLDNAAYRASFLPITKDTTNEIRVDILVEVR
tara:strand:+ start:163 stop:504 length:342 start_codon:yes stop_codon:yes gene_type:complete